MSKIIGTECEIELMVNCKTYPAVSTKYFETVCTGGVQASGEFVRLYPVPYRFLDDDQKYGRWDVIRAKVYRDSKDQRPESWHLASADSIVLVKHIKSKKERWQWMKNTVHPSTQHMDDLGLTNGCVEIIPKDLFWIPDEKEWSESQKRELRQSNFFISDADRASVAERVPWQYRLSYVEKSTGREGEGKVLAWSYYQGYQRRVKAGMPEKEALAEVGSIITKSLFDDSNTVYAIFGTHRLSQNWMISAIYHVPNKICKQGGLF